MRERKGKELPEDKPRGKGKQSSSTRSQRNILHSHARSLGIQPKDVNLTKVLQTLKPHDHLCLIYESPEEWQAAAVPFIAVGLKRGEKCFYIADTSTAGEIRNYLAEERIDVASTEKSGQLSILHQSEAYTKEDSFDPDSMIALLVKETEKAIAEGYPALRVTGEMTWVLRGHPGSEKLLEYEAKLNRDFFPYHPCLAICQYDRWKFDPEIIKGVIMTHPLLVRGNRIYHNFYYIPPEEFLDRRRAELEVQHWLNNIEREQQIQETLRQSEEKLRIIIESIPQGVAVSDLNARILQVNNAVLQLHGYGRQELIGHSAFTLIAEEDHAGAMDNLKKTLETGRSGVLEYTFTRKDGSTFPAQLSAALIKDGAGKPIGFVAVTEDITDRKRAKEALEKSEERYRQLTENAGEAILVIQDGVIKFINPKAAELSGYSIDEMVSSPFVKFIHPDDSDMVTDRYAKRLKGEPVPQIYDFRIIRKDGDIRWGELNAVPISWEDRPAVLCFMDDITERKNAEEALQAERNKLQSLIDAMEDNITIQDTKYNIIYQNEPSRIAFGDHLREKCYRIYAGREKICGGCPVQKAFQDGKSHTVEMTKVMPSGEVAFWENTANPIRDAGGRVVSCLEVAKNITDRKKMQEQLILTERLASIGQLAAGMAHELNNPLTGVIGFSEVLLEKDLPENIKEELVTINREARRAAKVVKGLLTFTREQGAEKTLMDINSIIQSILQLRSYEQRARKIEVDTRFASDLPQVMGNGVQLQQVFLNIIINAEQAMVGAHGRGKLTVATERVGNIVRASITDDGPGISPNNMKKLFTPFFTTREVGKGTGLSLSICHGIVTEHGGKLYAESKLDAGATFVVELPISK